MKKQPFHFAVYLLICLLVPLAAAAQTVDIPDANLRAKIEEALGKASGDAITVTNMETLTRLSAQNANISDLTGLEFAINLTSLNLGSEYVGGGPTNSNSVSDISPLIALTNLTELGLSDHAVSDISSAEVGQWLAQAQALDLTDATSQRGVLFLELLLAALTPKATALLPNYPNPFNP